MAGYSARQSTYTDGDVINAADSNDEFNAILAAFHASTGHNHDGTAGEGSRVTVVGTAADNVTFGAALTPDADNTIDIGTSGAQFKDLFINGTANIDSLVADTADINGGTADNVVIGGSTAAAITGTTLVANTSLNIAGDGATVTGIKDEDDMSSNSATKLATQQSIKAYVDAQVTAQDLDFQADSGGALGIDLDSETLTLTGGTGIDTSGSGNTVTFAIDSTVATLSGSQSLTNKTIDVDNNTVSNIEVDNLKSGVLDTDLSSVAGTDTTLASAKAIKAYVDAQVTASDLDFQGDSGGALSIDLDSETLDIAGGTGIDTSGSSNTLTVAIDSTVATLSGSQTLTNKSIDASQLTGTVANARLDAELQALAGLTSAADKGIQFTGSGSASTYDLTAAGKALLDDTNASAQRTTLGLAIGSDVQAYDAELAALAGLTSAADKGIQFTGSGSAATYDLTAAGKALLDDADASAQRTTLGVAIGSDVQAYDAGLASIAGLTTAANKIIYTTGSDTYAVTDFTAFGRSLVDDADAAAGRTTLGLGSAAVLTAGTSANNAVQLDGSARLPAVDGSQLTNLPATGATAGFAVAMAIAL